MTPVVSEVGVFNFAPWHSSLETDEMRVSDGEKVDEMIVLFFLYVTVTGTTRRVSTAAIRNIIIHGAAKNATQPGLLSPL